MKRMLRIIIGLIFAIAGVMQSQAQVNAEQVVNIGRNVLAMDDYMLAIQYFNQAIKAKPYLSDPYYYRALAKLYLDDFAGVEQDCSMALERNKFKTEAYKLRGFARQYLNKSEEALSDFNIGLEYNPKDRYFLYYKGIAEASLEKYAASDSTFSRLQKLYPKFEEAYTSRARTYILRGDTTAALNDLETSLNMAPAQLNAWLMLADVYAQRRQWEDASKALDEVAKLDPQLPGLYLNRAYIRYNNDDYFGAMSDYNYTITLEPDNTAAIYNRALLRYEVRDFRNALADFSRVLELEPDNFHARYNRGLIEMETGQYRAALNDFNVIAGRYPRFYQAYYAIAQCRQRLGDGHGATMAMYKADDIVRKYVANPKRNPLDRPTIEAGVSARKDESGKGEEDETAVMEKFNRLVTVSGTEETNMAYNERYRGKVQDMQLRVEPAQAYGLSFAPQQDKISVSPNYSRDLDNLNRSGLLPPLYLSNSPGVAQDSVAIKQAFSDIEMYSEAIDGGSKRPVDYLGRGVLYSMLKNYSAAIDDFNKALALDPNFATAYQARSYALMRSHGASNNGEELGINRYSLALADLDRVLQIYPEMEYAWFNKGVIYLLMEDYTAAVQCFSEALKLNSDFGEAYYNRGYSYLRMGNKKAATDDLRKSGELGILPSYNILKRMN